LPISEGITLQAGH